MATLAEIRNLVKKEESVLNQLVKRNADATVIEAQQQSVNKMKAELEAALNTPTEKAIQSKATEDYVTFCVVKAGETQKESKKINIFQVKSHTFRYTDACTEQKSKQRQIAQFIFL